MSGKALTRRGDIMNKINTMTKTTAEDFRTLIFFNMFLKKRLTLYFLIFAGIFSIAAIIAKLSGLIPVANWYFYFCLAFLGLILLQYLLFEYSVKRFLASDKLVIDNERSVVIDDSEITAEGGKENGAGTYQWDVFFSAYETKKYFYLYINTIQAIILPKRDFSEEEVIVLGKLFKEKLGKRFHKR
jgi:hypothetical protein